MSSYAYSRPYTQPARRRSPLQTLAYPNADSPGYGGHATRPRAPQGQPDPWDRWSPRPLNPGAPTADPRYPGAPGGGGGDLRGQDAPYHQAPAPGYESDPVYQQIVALANQNVADAQAQATSSRKQLAIGLGDPGLANSLHLGADTAYAAQNNPFSILSNLLRQHVGNVHGIDAGTNAANLFFSSTRGKELGSEQTGYQGGRANAASNAQAQLAQIASYLLAAQRQAAMDKANAAGDWTDRHAGDTPPPGDVALYALRALQSGNYTNADARRVPLATLLRTLSG